MSDLSAAVLLYAAAVIVFYAAINIEPINRSAERAIRGTLGLMLSIAAVATIYATFAYSVDVGIQWRSTLKIIGGLGAGLFAYQSWRIVKKR